MKLILSLLFFLLVDAFASEDTYALRAAYGKSTESDLYEILTGKVKGSIGYARVYALDGSYLLKKNLFDSPLDLHIASGLAYYDEGAYQGPIYELTLYLKLYYKFNILDTNFRFGFGEGGSYTSSNTQTEIIASQEKGGGTSHYLNYLDISLDVDLGSVFGEQSLQGTMLGVLIKHRSSIFGLINNVKKGGSNYNCFYIEHKF